MPQALLASLLFYQARFKGALALATHLLTTVIPAGIARPRMQLAVSRLSPGYVYSGTRRAPCRMPAVTRPGRGFLSTKVSAVLAHDRKAAPTPATAASGSVDPHWKQVLAELDKPVGQTGRKVVVCQVAPAVRVSISETYGLVPGACTAGQLVEGLRRLGFDVVFDTLFAADLCIMEEASELLHRLVDNLAASTGAEVEALPMFTSCCPGWIGLMEKSYPELIPYVSSCRSPQMMMGSLTKSYLAEQRKLKPSDICMVSIMPCTRKQGEADRDWYCDDEGVRDVDHVVTTVELGQMFKEHGITLAELPESDFDQPLGEGTGAAVLFGTTGGVMEAALRTAYEVVTKQPMQALAYTDVRGLEGIKESQVTLKPAAGTKLAELLHTHKAKAPAAAKGPVQWDGGMVTDAGDTLTLRVAVANGLGNAKKLISKMQTGEAKYDFVEIMACPAGCIGGGGQPRSTDKQVTAKRQAAIYSLDEHKVLRRSHENPAVQQVYADFLGQPLSHKAHELLHTHYVPGGVESGNKE